MLETLYFLSQINIINVQSCSIVCAWYIVSIQYMSLLSFRHHLVCAQHCGGHGATIVIKTDVAPAFVGLIKLHQCNI